MKTPNKKKKEEDILNGCFKLFLDKKQDITLAALEEVTGLTRGRIYYYFKDLDGLFRLAADFCFEKMVAYFNFFYQTVKTTLRDFIFDYVDNWKTFQQSVIDITGDETSTITSFFVRVSNLYPDLAQKLETFFQKEQKCWEEIILVAIRNKEVKIEEIDVPLTASKFYYLHMGIAIQSHFTDMSFQANTLQMLLLSLYNDIKQTSVSGKKNILENKSSLMFFIRSTLGSSFHSHYICNRLIIGI